MKISSIKPHRNYVLEIRTEDGRTGFFDVNPYLEAEVFFGLKKEQAFERVNNGGYFVEWEGGADFSADTIEARWRNVSHQLHGNFVKTNTTNLLSRSRQ